MRDGGVEVALKPPEFRRETLYISGERPGEVKRAGEKAFEEQLASLYRPQESVALEKLTKLKARLRSAKKNDFWALATEGLAGILQSQYAFISKRVLKDDASLAVEMPPIGEPGSCLMGMCIYVNDGTQSFSHENYRYHAYDCPCAYMRHEKIFIIPDHLEKIITENPNALPVPVESFFGVPLFADGKCVGHFGAMWSPEGATKRALGWGQIEMLMHAMEDLILDRLIEGDGFGPAPIAPVAKARHPRVIPHDAVSVAQSLKPYARSLSHELRTPMQGVVGMLDVMYATVQEATEGLSDARLKAVLQTLRENIEVVQDSSRRAVEAADNVVHAYDMNMGVPDSPLADFDDDDEAVSDATKPAAQRPGIVVAGNNMHLAVGNNKRKRDDSDWNFVNPKKQHRDETPKGQNFVLHSDTNGPSAIADAAVQSARNYRTRAAAYSSPPSEPSSPVYATDRNIVPGLRHAVLQDVIQQVVTDSLKVGGRPESAIAQEIPGGEIIEVRVKGSDGEERTKIIEWSVDANVPESILIDERELSKMISCIVLNAIKFTDQGKITIHARLSRKSRYIIVTVRDSGTGIPAHFLPSLFRPFAREDNSLTRQSEGLGLGLLVAKGLARKLGGDLFCVQSEIDGPQKGSIFEMRIPMTPSDVLSRPSSPFGSQSPRLRPRSGTPTESTVDDTKLTPATAASSTSPRTASRVLKDIIREDRLESHTTPSHITSQTSAPPANPLLRSPLRAGSPSQRQSTPYSRRHSGSNASSAALPLATRHPLNFLVAEDNRINRTILVNMLKKLGYKDVVEAYDGADAVRKMTEDRAKSSKIDVVLMDLWMPLMDGYEATERILLLDKERKNGKTGKRAKTPTILAVTADVTDGALARAARVGMKGFMTKPYKLVDLEKLIVEYCATQGSGHVQHPPTVQVQAAA